MIRINGMQEKSKDAFGLANIVTGYQLNSKNPFCINPNIKSISFIGKYYMYRKSLYVKEVLENIESMEDKSYINAKDSIKDQVLMTIPLSSKGYPIK